ncbi:AAA family ATPase [Methylocystis sp. L43]|uniref:AAA family ATPase n=1 Tax=unclassified Methylocystis TaxID=2625913 RepID=UPI0018C2F9F8|nr:MULTISPECIES: AAA family ATPase [unclassified Methylocystis]MBG0797113.1 AAA family ATPase [Methylocystis sp. L43]MBG0805016.1 AAA family ATPase [Methylocystis sp. H15]
MNTSTVVKPILTPSDTHKSSPEAKDTITILRPKVFTGKRLIHTPDGIRKEPAANAKTFRRLTREVAGVDDLYALLHEGRDEILIHGAALPDTPRIDCERRNEFFSDQALRLIVLDIDGFTTNARSLDEAAKEYRALLPAEFHDASCLAQASSGFNTKEGQQSFRLFFFADKPVTENQKSAWLIAPDTLPKTIRKRKDGKEIEVSTLDPSIWRRVQPVYIANPIVEGGADPCPERWLLIDGKPCANVPDALPDPISKVGKARGFAAPEGVTIDDPDALGDAIEKLATRRLEHAGNSRHLSIVYAGADFSDYGISPELAEAVTLAWAMPDEDHDEMLRDMLTDRGFTAADAQRKLARIAEIREELAAEHEGENPFAETDDFTVLEIAVKLEEGYRSARNGFGAKVATAGGKAFDSIAEPDGALPERQERKRQQKAESTTRQRFATFEQGALFTGDDDIFGEPDALPAVSGPGLLAALESDARFADDKEAMLAAHRAVNTIIRQPQGADAAERLAQLRALVEDGELPAHAEPVRYVNGARPPVLPIPVARRDLDDLPDVPWVAFQDYCRGVVSALVGDGGVSKSARGLVECVAIVAGRPDLLGIAPEDVATDFKRTNVWYHCQEDDKDALDRRLAGVLKELNVPWSAIDGTNGFRLYMTSGVGNPLLLALENSKGRVEPPAELAETVACVKQYGIGVVMLDPVQELHEVDENDNSAMAKVWASARSVAAEANTSVALIAHPRKPDGASSAGHAGNMHVLRGASSQTGVARIVRTMFSLTDDEAKQLNIPPQDRGRYARIDAAKNNLALKNWRPTYIERRTVQVGANKRSTVPVPVIVHLDAGLSPAAQKIVDALVVMGPGEHEIDAVLEKAGIPLDAFDDTNGHRARRIKRELFGKADKVERTTGAGTLRYHAAPGQRTPPTLSFTPKPDATGASFTPVDDEDETAADAG